LKFVFLLGITSKDVDRINDILSDKDMLDEKIQEFLASNKTQNSLF
jgi:hypothetical protein